jgi:hypothetical protein
MFAILLLVSLAGVGSASQALANAPVPPAVATATTVNRNSGQGQISDSLADRQSGECVAVPKDVDVTIPDDTKLKAGSQQTKTWRLTNCGTTTWDGYKIRYLTSNGHEDAWLAANSDLNGPAIVANVPLTKPGQTADVSITFTVPKPGTGYTMWYMMENRGGLAFRRVFWLVFDSTP